MPDSYDLTEQATEATPLSKRVSRAVIVAALVIGALFLLHFLQPLVEAVLVIFAGILFAVFLDGVARFVAERSPLSRRVSLALVVLSIAAAAGAFAWLAGPRIAEQATQLGDRIPEAVSAITDSLEGSRIGRLFLPNGSDSGMTADTVFGALRRMLGLLSSALGFATFVFIILFVGVYGAADPQLYAGSAVRLIRPGARERGVEVLKTLGHALRLWLVGRILSMTVVAILTVIGLLIAGVPLAFTLGLIAGLLSFVPLMGPLVSSIPAILVGLSDSPMKAVWVIVVFCAVQFLETYFITPLIQKRAVSIPPALLISSQVVMGVLAGVVGVLVATPLAVTAVVLVQMLYLEDRLGERVTIMGSG